MRTVMAIVALVLPLALSVPTARAAAGTPTATPEAAAVPPASPAPRPTGAWHLNLQAGTTAIGANNVLPLPFAIGAGLLLERSAWGLEAAIHVDGASYCDNPGGEGYCGAVWIFDVAPRFTPWPSRSFGPYLSGRFQLIESRPHGVVPAAGPRVGVRYRARAFGAYLEGGPSFIRAADGAFGQFVSNRTWFPQLSAGATFSLW